MRHEVLMRVRRKTPKAISIIKRKLWMNNNPCGFQLSGVAKLRVSLKLMNKRDKKLCSFMIMPNCIRFKRNIGLPKFMLLSRKRSKLNAFRGWRYEIYC